MDLANFTVHMYILKWLWTSRDDDTWEPMSNLDCPEIISLYEKKKKSTMAVSEPKKEQKEPNKRANEDATGGTKKKVPKKVCPN